MPPGGASKSFRGSSSSDVKRADFSATRCFTIAIDGSIADENANSRSDRETVAIREAAPLSGSATTAAAEGQDKNTKLKKPTPKSTNRDRKTQTEQRDVYDTNSSVIVIDDSDKQQNQQAPSDEKRSLSSSRTSSVNSLSGTELASLALSPAFLFSGISNTSNTSSVSGSVKRQFFWRNIVKQFNFTNEHERKLLISLTHGIQWMKVKTLPKAFIQRHREIFYLVRGNCYRASFM